MQGTAFQQLHPFQSSPSFAHLSSNTSYSATATTTSILSDSVAELTASTSQDLASLEEGLNHQNKDNQDSKEDKQCDDDKLLIEPFDASKWFRLPERGSPFSVGYDVFSATEHFVPAGQDVFISTNIKIKPPKGYYPQVVSRSGLARKNKIRVEAGTIDPDYRGELIVILANRNVPNPQKKVGEDGKVVLDERGQPVMFDKGDFVINQGDKIAQFILYAVVTPPVTLVPVGYLDQTERGAGGFGSTGTTSIMSTTSTRV